MADGKGRVLASYVVAMSAHPMRVGRGSDGGWSPGVHEGVILRVDLQ